MSVRKRRWKNARGEPQEAWIVDYVDQRGKRHIKTFQKKKAADAYQAIVAVDVRKGVHTPDSESVTIADAGESWIETGEDNNLERSSLNEYRRHLDMHIKPYLGNVKLSELTAPQVKEFRTKLRDGTRTPGQDDGAKRSPAIGQEDHLQPGIHRGGRAGKRLGGAERRVRPDQPQEEGHEG
jgi:integrase